MKKDSKQLLFERMHTIGGMPLKETFINEMSKRKVYPIETSQSWLSFLDEIKNKYDIDGIGINTKKNVFILKKSGYENIAFAPFRSEWLENAGFGPAVVDIMRKQIPNFVDKMKEKPKQERIRKIPPNAPIEDKIKMLDLVQRKAKNSYHSGKMSYVKTLDYYGYDWLVLYDEIKDTPEFIQYIKDKGYASNHYELADVLA